MGKSNKVLFTVIVCALMFTGGIVTGFQTSFAPAYAAQEKTLESECAKKAKANDIDHLFCVAIFGLQSAFGEAGNGIQQIIDLLTNPNFGLEEIKKEVSTIETEVLSEDHGLAEIKAEVRDIETRLASMQEQLDQIQSSLESCPNECSGNGVCLSGSCLCDAGFSGVDCSVSTACPNDCSGNGVCFSGSCFCNAGFSGADCSSSSSSCPNNCSGHGVCSAGSCFCDAGYSGVDCSVPPDDNFCATTSCNDGNICTVDLCEESHNNCIFSPAPGLACGENGVCDANGNCVVTQTFSAFVTNSQNPHSQGQGIISVWAFGGQIGIHAGNDMCRAIGADHVCSYTELLLAQSKGELADFGDLTGTATTSGGIWLHRLTPVEVGGSIYQPGAGGRCNDWTFPGNHIADGEFAELIDGELVFHFDQNACYTGNVADGCAGEGPLDGGLCGGVSRIIPCCYPMVQ